jgi:hypothetical protein
MKLRTITLIATVVACAALTACGEQGQKAEQKTYTAQDVKALPLQQKMQEWNNKDCRDIPSDENTQQECRALDPYVRRYEQNNGGIVAQGDIDAAAGK